MQPSDNFTDRNNITAGETESLDVKRRVPALDQCVQRNLDCGDLSPLSVAAEPLFFRPWLFGRFPLPITCFQMPKWLRHRPERKRPAATFLSRQSAGEWKAMTR